MYFNFFLIFFRHLNLGMESNAGSGNNFFEAVQGWLPFK